MRPRIGLVITDLDNTLYDWVSFFATALYGMVEVAAKEFGVPQDKLLDELREVHRKYHNSEQPFALLETRTVLERFAGLSRGEQAEKCAAAFQEFNRIRDRTLKLYPGVASTLMALVDRRVVVVGHTEASVVNALYRLKKLGIGQYFARLYAVKDVGGGHPNRERADQLSDLMWKVRPLDREERKPDPKVIFDICRDLEMRVDRTLYIGDSIARDIGMAKAAGAWSAWAKYGTAYDEDLWKKLVRITHWTEADVQRAQRAEELYGNVEPDAVLEGGFDEIECYFDFGWSGTGRSQPRHFQVKREPP